MATLAFDVQANYDSLIKLRQEVTRLQNELDKLNGVGTPEAIQALQTQLGAAERAFTSAAQGAAELGQAFTTNISDLSFGNVDDQVQILTLALHDCETALADGMSKLQQWQTEGTAALSAGDTQHVSELSEKIGVLATSLHDVQGRMEGYQTALTAITSGGVDSSVEGVANALSAVSDATARNDAAIAALSKEYDTLSNAMQRASSASEATTISNAQTAIQGEVTARKQLNSELQAQAAQLSSLQPALQGTVGDVEQQSAANDTLRTRIRALREEMAQLVAQGIDQQSEAYRNLTAELGRLQDIQGDIARQGSVLANDERTYAGLQSGLQGVTSAFMAAQGAMLLFGDANNSLQPLLQKTAAVMAIVNSLQQVSQMLNKDSAFRLVTLANAQDYWNKLLAVGRGEQVADNAAKVANTAATTANTAAVQAQTAAKSGNSKANATNTASHTANTVATTAETTATITLTGAVKMATVAMKDLVKAIPVWGWVLAAVTAVITGISALISKIKESNKTIQTAALTAEEAAKKIAEDIYKPIGSIQLLREQWARLGDDFQAKQKFIQDNAETFKALKLTIDSVADAERVLIQNTDAYINAMVQRAKANILAKQVEDDVKTIAELEQRLQSMDKYTRTAITFWTQQQVSDSYIAAEKEIQTRKELLQDLVKQAADANEVATQAETAAGMTTTTTTTETPAATTTTTTSTATAKDLTKETQRYKELVATQGKERARAAVAAQLSLQQAEIDAIAEGNDKTMAQIHHDYEMQRVAIEQWYEDLKEEKIKDAKALWDANPDTKGQAFDVTTVDTTYTDQENAMYAAQTAANERQRKESIDAIQQAETKAMNDYLAKYGDYLQKRQALTDKYQQAMSAATTEGERMTLTKEYEQDLYDLDNAAQRTTSLIAQLFADMSDKSIASIRAILDNAQLLMQYLASERDSEGNATINGQTVSQQDILDLGVTPETLSLLENSPEQLANLKKGIDNLNKELGNKSPFTKMTQDLKSAWEMMKNDFGGGIMKMVSALNEFIPQVEQFGKDLGTIFGNDKIGEGVTRATQAFKGLGTMAGGIGQAMSGDIVGGIMSATSGLASVVTAIGGLFTSESDKTLHKDMEALTASNQALQHSVDELTDTMAKSTTSLSQATQDYETAKKNLEQMESDTASIMQRAGTSHSTGIFNSDHSSNYYVNQEMTAKDWEAVSEAAGKSVTSASDFWKLTSEEMYHVSVQAAAQYAKIKQYADDGHDDVAQYMDEYIEYYKEAQELQDSLNEKMTATTFDSLVSSFQSAVMDMEHTSADFANDFEELMQNAVVSSLMSSRYSQMLEDWYNTFAGYMENDSQLTTTERDALKAEYDDIVDQATKEIKEIYDMMGWNTSANTQVAQSTAWQTMSEDTGQELNGRFTALQEAAYNILDVDRAGQVTFDELLVLAQSQRDIASDMRTTIAQAYLELQAINDNTAATVTQLRTTNARLQDIADNTDRL